MKSTAWDDIKNIMPWIVDAFGCLFMDLAILMQHHFYTAREKRRLVAYAEAAAQLCSSQPR